MKALKSQLAKDLLADQQARSELRRFLVGNRSQSSSPASEIGRIQVRSGVSSVTVNATFVPKAKAD